MNHILVFYNRKEKKDLLTQARAEVYFGPLKHFEQVGWVRSEQSLDLDGMNLYHVESRIGRIKKVSAPVKGKWVIVYYLVK